MNKLHTHINYNRLIHLITSSFEVLSCFGAKNNNKERLQLKQAVLVRRVFSSLGACKDPQIRGPSWLPDYRDGSRSHFLMSLLNLVGQSVSQGLDAFHNGRG